MYFVAVLQSHTEEKLNPMSHDPEHWEDFVRTFREMTPGEQQRERMKLSREQRTYLDTLLEDGTENLAIRFIDFAPRQLEAPSFLVRAKYEDLGQALVRLNRWIEESEVEILNIETIVLPNMHRPREEGTHDVAILAAGESPGNWHQFFRVWYRPLGKR